MNTLRKLIASLMWRLQCCDFVRRHVFRWGNLGGGRHVDWQPLRCLECGWIGPTRWAFHTYEDDGSGEDVCAVDECPKCGSKDLCELSVAEEIER